MILESRQRKLADCSGPFYKTHTRRARNPATGSWRIVQVRTIYRANGGESAEMNSVDLNNPLTAVGGIQTRSCVRFVERI